MQLLFQILGCGTSTGVPLPACPCAVCNSDHPRNKRTRCSGVLKLPDGHRVLIDASTDLRQQAITWGLRRIDAVFFTHAHADHILGVEDLRGYNFIQRAPIPCFASAETNQELQRFYQYIFNPSKDYEGGGLAQLILNEISPGRAVHVHGVSVLPFQLFHGRLPVLGFRVGDFAYATDCNRIPDTSLELLRGVRTLVLDGLRYEKHPTHFSIDEACSVAASLGVERTLLTHTTHTVDYETVSRKLPAGVELAYDGLELVVTCSR